MTISAARLVPSTRIGQAAITTTTRCASAPHPILLLPDVPDRVRRIVYVVATRRGVALANDDLDDCSQAVWLRLIPAFKHLDPARDAGGGAGLLTRTVVNATKDWLTARIAGCRDVRRQRGLRRPLERLASGEESDGDDRSSPTEPIDVVGERGVTQRLLADDLWTAIRHLPGDVRHLAWALHAHSGDHQAARCALGWSRWHFEHVYGRLRRALTAAGFSVVAGGA